MTELNKPLDPEVNKTVDPEEIKILDEKWVVGFVDGEGCFHLDVHSHATMKWGLQMQPEFTVVQHQRDKKLLDAHVGFFECGSVSPNRKDSTSTRYHYRVKNLNHLVNHVIPFFDKHPLQTKKIVNF